MENLLRPDWSRLDSGDLIAILSQTFGGYQLAADDTVSYPTADEARITIRYEGSRIAAITPDRAFDPNEWENVATRIEKELVEAVPATARRIAFCHYRVKGWWRSDRLGVQVLPPPPEAPDAPVEHADHPFVLEYPVMRSSNGLITNQRDAREYRRLTGLLNVLLEGQVTSVQPTARHFWAFVGNGKMPPDTLWVQEGYFCPDFRVGADTPSEPGGHAMTPVPANDYYAIDGLESWRGLQVPDTLEDSLVAYRNLSPEQRERFDRACFWWDVKDRAWTISRSASYGATVTAVEALLQEAAGSGSCQTCGRSLGPGPTKLFQDFLETYAPGGGIIAEGRARLYRVRSAISHGDKLMRNDLDVEWGISPAMVAELDLHGNLWRLVRIALINWLHQNGGGAAKLEVAPQRRGRMMSKTISGRGAADDERQGEDESSGDAAPS